MGEVRSGTVVIVVLVLTAALLPLFISFFGWDPTWRSLGVTPLEPHFFDTHAVADHAACAAKGYDAYTLTECDNFLPFNYPPVWLWIGYIGVDGSDSTWIALLLTSAAALASVLLFRGRSIPDGLVCSLGLLSPPVMMAVERGNIDLSIYALVAIAAVTLHGRARFCTPAALGLLSLSVILKLYPIFCVGMAARPSRSRVVLAGLLTLVAGAYYAAIAEYLPKIRAITPTTYMLSYGYKTIFLGLDRLRVEAGLPPFGFDESWLPLLALVFAVLCAAAVACTKPQPLVSAGLPGTAFLFGAGIYCGTFCLGTNFMYRMMFLLLCIPQLLDWTGRELMSGARWKGQVLLFALLSTLWSMGANGHESFMLISQLMNWVLFTALIAVMMSNMLQRFRMNYLFPPPRRKFLGEL
jgi:hypothetical protein